MAADGWERTTLGEIATVTVGGTPSTKQPSYWGDAIPWVTPTDITALEGRLLTGTARSISELGLEKSSARLVRAGSVLITTRATIGPAAIAGCELAMNQGVTALEPGPRVDDSWLYWWAIANRSSFVALGAGNTFPEVSRTKSRRIALEVPPLAEQQRIADLLDCADSVLDEARNAAHRTDALLQTLTRDLCPVNVEGSGRPLSQLASYDNGRPFRAKDFTPEGLPVIRIQQLRDPSVKCDRYEGDLDPRNAIDDGDLIFSWSGSLLVERWRRGPAALNQHLFKVTERAGIDRTWLMYTLRSALDQLSRMTHGTTMKHITKKSLDQVSAVVPEHADQVAIGAQLAAVEAALHRTREHQAQIAACSGALCRALVRGDRRLPESYDRFLEADPGLTPQLA